MSDRIVYDSLGGRFAVGQWATHATQPDVIEGLGDVIAIDTVFNIVRVTFYTTNRAGEFIIGQWSDWYEADDLYAVDCLHTVASYMEDDEHPVVHITELYANKRTRTGKKY
jgi:hypothetical protein